MEKNLRGAIPGIPVRQVRGWDYTIFPIIVVIAACEITNPYR